MQIQNLNQNKVSFKGGQVYRLVLKKSDLTNAVILNTISAFGAQEGAIPKLIKPIYFKSCEKLIDRIQKIRKLPRKWIIDNVGSAGYNVPKAFSNDEIEVYLVSGLSGKLKAIGNIIRSKAGEYGHINKEVGPFNPKQQNFFQFLLHGMFVHFESANNRFKTLMSPKTITINEIISKLSKQPD